MNSVSGCKLKPCLSDIKTQKVSLQYSFIVASCVGTNFHCQLYHRLASNIFCNYSTGVEIPSMSMHQTVPLERYKCEKDSKLWSKNKAVVDDRQCDDCHCTETEESLCTNRRTPILKGLL
jgi:hypothetical protein